VRFLVLRDQRRELRTGAVACDGGFLEYQGVEERLVGLDALLVGRGIY
jgi:hypothetical protein